MGTLFPALFLAHGSPMLALSRGDYAHKLQALGRSLPRPQSILVISAHWYTQGTYVLDTNPPEQVYDFGGFPPELYQYHYRPSGAPGLARHISQALCPIPVEPSDQWGLDHGAWTLLTHLYPEADIPVSQLSIDRDMSPAQYLDLGRRLRFLREEEVLIIGSGNIVHNLSKISWDENAPAWAWAREFDEEFRQNIKIRDYHSLCDYISWGDYARLSVPTMEHLAPVFYFLGLLSDEETPELFHTGIQHGSVSMTGFLTSV